MSQTVSYTPTAGNEPKFLFPSGTVLVVSSNVSGLDESRSLPRRLDLHGEVPSWWNGFFLKSECVRPIKKRGHKKKKRACISILLVGQNLVDWIGWMIPPKKNETVVKEEEIIISRELLRGHDEVRRKNEKKFLPPFFLAFIFIVRS